MDPFLLEIYFAKYEFSAKYLLCCSDAETIPMKELLALADEECTELWENCSLGYTETAGHPVLRQVISEAFYPPLDLNNIHCFCGAEEAIYATFRALLLPGDEVICITPAYQSLVTIPESIITTHGGKLICVDLEDDWTLNVQKIEAVINPTKTKLIIMNFPHNPTGALITSTEQAEIIHICKKNGIILFSDEVYRGQEIDESLRLCPSAVLYENAISLGVLSKSIGLAGLRIGWIACQNKKILNKIADYKHYLSICNSAPSEILVIISLRNYDKLLQRNKQIILENKNLFEAFINRHSNLFSWIPPKGGCVGFVYYKGIEHSLDELCDILVQTYGVLLLPGSQFPGGSKDYSRYFRLGFGRRSFPEALLKFEEALHLIFS